MESNEIKKIIPFDDIWDNLNVLEDYCAGLNPGDINQDNQPVIF